MVSPNLNIFFTLIAASVTLFLGVIVYLHNRRSATSRIFAAHSLVGTVWAIINYFSLAASPLNALFFIRGVLVLAVPHVFLFFLFSRNFPNKKLIVPRRQFWGVAVLGSAMMLLAFSSYIFKSIDFSEYPPTPIPGTLMPFFSFALVFFFLVTIGIVIKKYILAREEVRRQWLAIGIGLVMAYTLLIALVFIRVIAFRDPTFVPYSPLFILPIFAGAAYAILRHHLFAVRVIATEVFSFILLVAGMTQVLLAQTRTTLLVGLFMVVFLLVFSVLLVRSVLREVRAREQIERLAKELEAANAELKKLDLAKSEFISLASHQLRAPLTIVKGYISMLREGSFGKVEKQMDTMLSRVYGANEHLIKLVADFLNLSRIESGKLKYVIEPTSIEQLIEEVVVAQRANAASRGIVLRWNPPRRALPLIEIDREKIHQSVFNLVDNAIKYTEKGSVDINVETPNPRAVRLVVRDTGAGLSDEDKQKLFKKFSRATSGDMNASGLGIGLYLAAKLVDDHHGRIWAESEGQGKGSAFIVELPVHSELAVHTDDGLLQKQQEMP